MPRNKPQKAEKPRVRHQITVDFDDATRTALDSLAASHGLHTDGNPHDAEIVRLLLVAELTAGEPLRQRVARALYCNTVLILSQRFSESVYELREGIGKLASVAARARSPVVPEHRGGPRPKTHRNRAFVTFNDWLRYALLDRLPEVVPQGKRTPPDLWLVRNLLASAVENIEQHEPLIAKYGEAIRDVRAQVDGIVVGMRDRLVAHLEAL